MKIVQAPIDVEKVVSHARKNGMDYMDLEWENRKYCVSSFLLTDQEPFRIINHVHQEVVNIMVWLCDKKEHLLKILPEKIADVIVKKPGRISPLQRYDVLVNTQGEYKIVEVNSETPAGIPETCNSYLFDEFVELDIMDNANRDFEDKLLDACKQTQLTNVDVILSDDSDWSWEDVTNAAYLSSFWSAIWLSGVYDAASLDFKEQWLYYKWKRVQNIHSFYPLEWIFEDDGGEKFRQYYLEWKIDLANGPINLISQSKAFRAWVFENIDLLDQEGIDTWWIQQYVPKYYFSKQPWTIAKPRLFREWVWIGEDMDWSVYQEYIEQREFECLTFEWVKKWYLTFWVYTSQQEPIGCYCRFCEQKITDYTSYFLPVYTKHEENSIDLRDLMPGPSTWMM